MTSPDAPLKTSPQPPRASLVFRWQWLPTQPPSLTTPLPPAKFRDDAAFRGQVIDPSEMTTYQFSFPQLSSQTADLHFYRLIRVFNTPLLSITPRDSGRSDHALWSGIAPVFVGTNPWAHLWFFADQTDGDTIAVVYGFDGGFTLHATLKDGSELERRHDVIVRELYR